jgi:hypothetical protein
MLSSSKLDHSKRNSYYQASHPKKLSPNLLQSSTRAEVRVLSYFNSSHIDSAKWIRFYFMSSGKAYLNLGIAYALVLNPTQLAFHTYV